MRFRPLHTLGTLFVLTVALADEKAADAASASSQKEKGSVQKEAGAARDSGGTPIFDGKSLSGWVKADGKPVEAGKGWEAADGVLYRSGKGGDIFTEKEYGDFEFTWEWKISPGGNSGVKYRVTAYGKEMLGPEYQLLDDDKHADGKLSTHRSACIYDLFPVPEDRPLRPVGEWNMSKIVAKGGKFEHWLNGVKVAEADTASQAWKDAVAKSKFRNRANWAQNAKGRIMLQDHGDAVWFRNLCIKELAAE